MKRAIAFMLFAACCLPILAQDAPVNSDSTKEQLTAVSGKVDGLEESYLGTLATVDKLAKIKVSGYMQLQFRMAMDTAGVVDATGKYLQPMGDMAGGKFSDGSYTLFQVRRGRLKLGYETAMTSMYIQGDYSTGGFEIKDAYLTLTEPWLKSITLTGGIFNRPFGYEIEYSSSNRESPERSRLFQVLFPKERDLGAMITVKPAEKMGLLSRFNLKAGLFNGTQANLAENDAKKDVIGRFGFSLPFTDINLSIDGGVSAYMGSVTCTDTSLAKKKYDTTYVITDTAGGVNKYKRSIDSVTNTRDAFTGADSGKKYRGFEYEIVNKVFTKSAIGQFNKQFDRTYYGGDLQVYYDLPVIGGMKILTEAISGQQPGTSSSTSYYNPGRSSNSAVYMRNFMGYCVMYVQNIFKKNQLVVKYDSYDPNTDVTGSDFEWDANANEGKGGIKNKLSAADLAFNTVGLGWIYHWDENVKIMLYYDMVANEKAAALANAVDKKGVAVPAMQLLGKDYNDNMLTCRVQYKF